MAAAKFLFVCGDDDYVVTERARARYAALAAGISDDYGREVIEGHCQTVDEVGRAVENFAQAVQTLSMFGERKAVWFKDVSFLGEGRSAKAEGTKAHLERLLQVLEQVDPASVGVLISACPVDRRRTELKWLLKHGEAEDIKANEGMATAFMDEACARHRVRLSPEAREVLIARVHGNTRVVANEIAKLAAYLGEDNALIEAPLVVELVPVFGEGEFFEPVESFFALDMQGTWRALERHFFTQKDPEARPLIAALQNRNRLLIQIRVLIDSGEVSVGSRGMAKGEIERLARKYQQHFGDDTAKSNLNLFTQNPWYIGTHLAPVAARLPLKKLIAFQMAFMDAFESLLQRPKEEHHEVMRELVGRCLGS